MSLTLLAVLVPIVAAILVAALPRSEPALARGLGFVGALVELGVLAALVFGFDPTGPELQREVTLAWMPGYGIAFSLGVDGRALAGLTVLGLVFPLALLIGGRPRPGEPPLIIGLLALQAAWVTVVLARDLVTLAAAWELAAVLLLILVGERGDGKAGVPGRTRAARRLAARALVGAAALVVAVILLGVAHAHATGGAWTWDIDELASVTLAPGTQALGFALVVTAVVATIGLVPLQGGLVRVCVAGPTPVVAALLGAGMPVAVDLLRRVGVPLFPLTAGEWADPIAALAVVGSLYAALVCWAEREPGRVLAHVALVHLGLALVAAVSGSPSANLALGPYLLAHGLGLVVLTSVLHSLRRDGVANLGELSGWAAAAPRGPTLALLASLLLMGAPGSAGFIGELGIVVGVVREADVELLRPASWGLLATLAVALGSLGVVRSLWHAARGSPFRAVSERITELDLRETLIGAAALSLALVLGLAPNWLLTRAEPAERAAVERLHYARCLALELGESSRPRVLADVVAGRDGVCVDPVATLRAAYGLGGADEEGSR